MQGVCLRFHPYSNPEASWCTSVTTRRSCSSEDMPRSSTKPHVLKILLLSILGVAIGPIYFLAVWDTTSITPSFSTATSNHVEGPPSSLEAATSRRRGEAATTNSSPLRLILHVGLPKTATSAIQCRLSDMERHDVYVIEKWYLLLFAWMDGRSVSHSTTRLSFTCLFGEFLEFHCRRPHFLPLSSLSKVLSAKIVEIESCRTEQFLHKVRIQQYLENFPLVPLHEIRNQSLSTSSSKYTTYERVIKGSSVLQHCLDIWITQLYQQQQQQQQQKQKQHNDSGFIPDCRGNSYQKYIHNYHQKGYSTFIISNENLALPSFGKQESTPQTCDTLFHNMLHSLGKDSEIDIVLSQRLHFDRMISMFGQEYDGEKFYTRPRLTRWPDKGGDAVPFLEDYIRDFPLERLARSMNCFRYVSSTNPRIRWRVLDFHNKKTDIVTSFVNVITRNDTLPPELANGHWTLGTENMAMERDGKIHYDRIAVAAKKAGLLPKSATRNEVRNAVSKYLEEKGLTMSDLKMKCPSETFYDDLIKATAMIHQMSFPKEPANIIRQKLRMFDVPHFRDLFCEVDGNATLHDEVMQSFLAQYKT
ncbi:hypothetical protein HJC23_003021 [Cyclotella cryptica]|uniref:Sulfotransferase domain-containing protein n=1 Tax=Cyclotella cryptica TaxID=29204 RepID=A0ABD3PTC6_9STRA